MRDLPGGGSQQLTAQLAALRPRTSYDFEVMQRSIPIGVPQGSCLVNTASSIRRARHFSTEKVNPRAAEGEELWNLKSRRNSDRARNTRRRVNASRLCFLRPRDSAW
jgi:hypothetical protein